MARSRGRSRSLARRSVSVKPVVIRTTKVVKAKRRHGGGGGGRGMFGGLLGPGSTEMLMAGAALGFLDKSSFAANLPKLPFLGEHGTIAIAAYMFSQGGKNKLASNVSKGAMFLSAYELVKSGSISGDEDAMGF